MPISMKPSTAFYLTLVFAAGQRALAVNDWSVPCTQGKCSWDLPAGSGSGSVNIWGPSAAISDITPATGWQITTKCDPVNSKQDITIVCQNNDPNCDHLFQGNGAVNTIVRLPDNCGPMPFARVSQHQQSNLGSRGNDSAAPVHQLTLDTDFGAAGPTQGEVSFSVQGQNGQNNAKQGRRSHRRFRSLAMSRNNVYRRNDTIFRRNDTTNSTTNTNSTANGNSTTDGVNNVNDALSIGSFNKTLSANPAPINFNQQKNLFNSGSGSIDVGASVQASVSIGAVAAGTIIPPKITEFEITFGLDGNADASFNVTGDISGGVSSGNITIFQTGLPGLSIPKILEIGPQFALMGRVDANFGLKNVNAGIDVNYDLSGASFVFPPPSQGGSNTNGISSTSKQVTFSANPDVGASVSASAHIIPQISLGLSALDKLASASVFLDVDASLGLNGSISNAANPQPCLAGNADISVGVGAQGSFFSIFDQSVGKTIFDKNFPLFQKCFAGSSNSTNSTSSSLASSQSATATTNSTSQTSAGSASASATNSASQTSAGSASASATNSASQTSAGSATVSATNSASQTSAGSATASATDSASQTSAGSATVSATDSASQTSAGSATASATDSASQTSAGSVTATGSASQASSSAASATANSRRNYHAPRPVRHSARFGRIALSDKTA